MKKQVIFILIFLLPFLIYAQTTIPGGYVNGTWLNSGSPYEIMGDITVPNGDTLTIEPGVQVVFQNEYTFTIEGNLQAIGTETDSIRFTVQDTIGYASGSYTGWNGLRIYYAVDSSKFDYCIVEYSKGFGLYGEESDTKIDNTSIKYNSTGVYVVAGSGLEINNSIIENNRGDGIYINYYSTFNATNVTCHENLGNGTSVVGDCGATLNNYNSTNNGGTGMIVFKSSFSFIEGSVSNNLDGGFAIDESTTSLEDLTIQGNIKSGNGGGIFCDYGSTIIGTNLIIQYNNAEDGGGIYLANQSNIALDSTTIYYNYANQSSGLGGGIYIERSTLNVSNSSIVMCLSFMGGGVYILGNQYEPAYLTGSNLSINANTALASGGGLYCLTNTHVDLDGTTFFSNHANLVSGNGGGLYMKASILALLNSSVTGGRAYNGAGMYIDSCDYQITNCVFSGNMADNNGGGISQRKGIAVISNVQFNSNSGNEYYSSSSGGGIYAVQANLTLSNSSFSNNHASHIAGGLYSIGSIMDLDSVDFSGCYVSNQGSGGGMVLFGSPDCNLTDVNFSNCSCDYKGAGLFCSGSTISLLNVVFEGNQSENSQSLGGGMYCSSSTVSAIDVEFTENHYRGLYCVSSNISMLNSEISNNYDGGIYLESSILELERTLVNNNYFDFYDHPAVQIVQNSQLDIVNCTFVNNQETSIVSDATSTVDVLNSIIWDNASPAIGGSGVFTSTYSDIQDILYSGTGNIILDPLFADPGNDDFNLSWVNFPINDATKSPCIDAGNPTSLKDPDNTRIDMGNYYYHQDHTPIIGGDINDTLFCTESPYFVLGDLTIPVGEELVIEPCVRIIFQGDYRLKVEGRLLALGNKIDSIYFYPSDTTNGWQGIRFINQNTNGQDSSKLVYCNILYGTANGYGEDTNGGGIYCINSSELLIKNCGFSHNYAYNSGGGIYADSSNILIQNCYFSLNEAYGGGGIYVSNSPGILIDNTEILDCTAYFGGGLFCDFSSSLNAGNLLIHDNNAVSGGGIYVRNQSTLLLNNSTINNNQAEINYGRGGGIYIKSSTVNMANSSITNCESNDGGGIYILSSTVNLANSSITNCESNDGGGIYIEGIDYGPTYFTGVNLLVGNNSSNHFGGGIYCLNNAHLHLDSTTISNNQAELVGGVGGGIFINAMSLSLSYVDILNCSASHAGGGIYSFETQLYSDNVDFSGCYLTAQGAGGGGMAIYDSPYSNLTNVSFTNCSDYDFHGGGISCYNSSISLQHVNFNDNNGTPGGGIYCSTSSLSAIDVEFNGNSGGGLFCTSSTLTMSNAEFNDNFVGINAHSSEIDLERILINNTHGEGIQVGSNSQLDIKNCTFVNNLGQTIVSDATSTVSIMNSVVWDNATPAIGVSGTLNVEYSNIQDALYPGTGNIAINPLFTDPATDDYSLSWLNFPVIDPTMSPCIDTGDPLTPADPDGTQADMGFLPYDQYYELDLIAFLEGPFFISQMIPFLNIAQYIPHYQPYILTPWNYAGLEFVNEIPGNDIIDWILVELRDADGVENAASSTNFDRQALFIKSDGSVVGLDGINLPRFYPDLTNDLYVVIKHRNHLGILSAVSLEKNGKTYSYDFTNGEDKVYGGIQAHKQLNTGVWGLSSADGDANSQVDNKDKNDIWFLQQSLSGYLQGDFDMNSEVESNDKLLWEENVGKSGFVPE